MASEIHTEPTSPALQPHRPSGPSAQPAPVIGRAALSARMIALLAGGGAALIVGGIIILLLLGSGRTSSPAPTGGEENAEERSWGEEEVTLVSVNTVIPQHKTLVRTLEQPCSIRPWAQAELYAKTSGNLKSIRRHLTPPLTVELIGRELAAASAAPLSPPLASAAQLAVAAELALHQAPQIDIGSYVTAGELLMTIDVPELFVDIAQKESVWQQRLAELEEARTAIATYEATIQAAEAQRKQAEAEVQKAISDHAYQRKLLVRLQELVRREATTPERADEQMHQVDSAQAAIESSRAKLMAVQAEQTVVASKLATARSDLLVKEALVRVAQEDLNRARAVAEYAHICAPFDGILTERSLDEGDFIQNSTSGLTHILMTITSLDKVKVVLQVPERDARWVRQGTEATVHVDARMRWQFKGRVSRISHSLDNQSRTMRAEIDLPNHEGELMPGMYGQVVLTLWKIENALAIPSGAVYSRGDLTFILEVHEGVVSHHPVRILYDDGHEVQVVKLVDGKEEPLDGSEELVVSNKRELRDGQHVKTTVLTSP